MKTNTIEEATKMHKVDYKGHGFETDFSVNVRTVKLSVWIVVTDHVNAAENFGVYICHGVPSGPFWRNCPPLVRCKTMCDAKEVAARIFGIFGSGDLAEIVTAW